MGGGGGGGLLLRRQYPAACTVFRKYHAVDSLLTNRFCLHFTRMLDKNVFLSVHLSPTNYF